MIDFTLAELLTGLDMSDNVGDMTNPVSRIKELMKVIDFFGSMHIVVDDGNTEDGHLDFVEAEMAKHPPIPEEIELLSLLRPMSPDERYEAMENEPGAAEATEADKPEL